MFEDLKELKKVQVSLDKLRDKKNALIASTEDKIKVIEEERVGLRILRENIMEKIAR